MSLALDRKSSPFDVKLLTELLYNGAEETALRTRALDLIAKEDALHILRPYNYTLAEARERTMRQIVAWNQLRKRWSDDQRMQRALRLLVDNLPDGSFSMRL